MEMSGQQNLTLRNIGDHIVGAAIASSILDEHQRREKFVRDSIELAKDHPEAAAWYAKFNAIVNEIRTTC